MPIDKDFGAETARMEIVLYNKKDEKIASVKCSSTEDALELLVNLIHS